MQTPELHVCPNRVEHASHSHNIDLIHYCGGHSSASDHNQQQHTFRPHVGHNACIDSFTQAPCNMCNPVPMVGQTIACEDEDTAPSLQCTYGCVRSHLTCYQATLLVGPAQPPGPHSEQAGAQRCPGGLNPPVSSGHALACRLRC